MCIPNKNITIFQLSKHHLHYTLHEITIILFSKILISKSLRQLRIRVWWYKWLVETEHFIFKYISHNSCRKQYYEVKLKKISVSYNKPGSSNLTCLSKFLNLCKKLLAVIGSIDLPYKISRASNLVFIIKAFRCSRY